MIYYVICWFPPKNVTKDDQWLTFRNQKKWALYSMDQQIRPPRSPFLDLSFDEIPLLRQPKHEKFRWERAMNVKSMQIFRWSRIDW